MTTSGRRPMPQFLVVRPSQVGQISGSPTRERGGVSDRTSCLTNGDRPNYSGSAKRTKERIFFTTPLVRDDFSERSAENVRLLAAERASVCRTCAFSES